MSNEHMGGEGLEEHMSALEMLSHASENGEMDMPDLSDAQIAELREKIARSNDQHALEEIIGNLPDEDVSAAA